MAIAFVQSPATSDGNVNGLTVAYASNVTVGSLLVIIIGVATGTAVNTPTDSVGTTYALDADISGTGIRAMIYSGIAPSGGANTVTTSAAGTVGGFVDVAEFTGVNSSSALDTTTTNSGLTSAPTATAITPTADGCLVIATYISGGSNPTGDPPTNFTSFAAGPTSGRTGNADYEIQSTAAARTPAWVNDFQFWAVACASYKPAPLGLIFPNRRQSVAVQRAAYW